VIGVTKDGVTERGDWGPYPDDSKRESLLLGPVRMATLIRSSLGGSLKW
jgi:hypothetical protein